MVVNHLFYYSSFYTPQPTSKFHNQGLGRVLATSCQGNAISNLAMDCVKKTRQNENKCLRLFDPTFAHIHATTNSKPRLLRSRGVEFPTPRAGGRPFVYLPNAFATQHGIKILPSSSSRTPRQQQVRHQEQQQQQQQQQPQQEQEKNSNIITSSSKLPTTR